MTPTRGRGGMATNERGHERRHCNAPYPWEQSPGEGARSQPGNTLAEDLKSGSPAPKAREGAGRGEWQLMANGPTD